ncbi:hypothetical protein CWS43_02155 [Rahnella sp. AA]|uniref:diguanylate cyclase n=1 Tax=Rahnella sp. AA TaxID=2057180 RepID=UPI000C31F861|nr:diguanylate cyclase [Rahnella sp. AA]PKE32730.1 hypothetical protein CWS43_02155 [Rahnella sp. AA]
MVISLPVSVSIGLVEREVDESVFSLMRRADRALYDAKSSGKNRYAMAAPLWSVEEGALANFNAVIPVGHHT